MKKFFTFLLLFPLAGSLLTASAASTDNARIYITDASLMHESRATPYPGDGWTVDDRAVSFQWPMPLAARGLLNSATDYATIKNTKTDKKSLRYRLRYGQDPKLKKNAVTVATEWPFHNPAKPLEAGKWYWQYSFVGADGKDSWSPVYSFTVGNNPNKFTPPNFADFIAKLPGSHPRILVTADNWDQVIESSKGTQDRQWYIEAADKALATPMKDVKDIRTDKVASLKNESQREAYLTRESRRIIDAEESACDALIRSYLLTKDRKYADEAIRRILVMADWNKNENVKGDFNDATLLSLCSIGYDSFYNILTPEQKETMLQAVKEKASKMYDHYNNYLENHIAENHIWQMTMRINAMAALATYGDLAEASKWAEYYYNVWLCRFPGLNQDGAWHNGDSYFTVNTRTLVELPMLYSRISGFNFFADPWYENNILYTIYNQPPFSKSAGNGSSHQNVDKPNAIRIGYLDALAKITGNTYAADFVRRTLKVTPDYLRKAIGAKPGDLGWVRILLNKPLPEGPGLETLPAGHVFPQSGLAEFHTDWNRVGGNAMLSFRSSPYGSTSHALANQNAFNTFYGGQPLFYSAGHHTSFVDRHALTCHRGSFGHNTILPNGMSQKIGVEGFGWIPRHYTGKTVGYVLGDASNAYGKVESPLWLDRGRKQAEMEYTPADGWDKNHVKTFRRHMINLGNSGWVFIYDELEADSAIHWDYTLHAVKQPIVFDDTNDKYVHVTATAKTGSSDAYIFSSGALACDTTSLFRVPAVNWLKGDANGKFKPNPNHYHFKASSGDSKVYRFATVINTHGKKREAVAPVIAPDGRIKIPRWNIKVNLDPDSKPMFVVKHNQDNTSIVYKGGETIITEDGKETVLKDELPQLEI